MSLKNTLKYSVVGFITLLVLVIIIVAVSGPSEKSTVNPSQSQSQPKSQPELQKNWHSVTTFSGNGIKTTSPFSITGDRWRINWDTTGEFNFQIFVGKTDKSFTSCTIMANIIGNGSDTSYCYESGEFYLTANTGNDWDISIEEYR